MIRRGGGAHNLVCLSPLGVGALKPQAASRNVPIVLCLTFSSNHFQRARPVPIDTADCNSIMLSTLASTCRSMETSEPKTREVFAYLRSHSISFRTSSTIMRRGINHSVSDIGVTKPVKSHHDVFTCMRRIAPHDAPSCPALNCIDRIPIKESAANYAKAAR